MDPVQFLPQNKQGRDIIIGDLHGMKHVLDLLMLEVNFDKRVDRLISVGDLIDRGPANEQVLSLLDAPWFFPVRGNHDQFLIDSVDSEVGKANWMNNGGIWSDARSQSELKAYARALDTLPYLIEIEQENSLPVGIVHADLPLKMSWPDVKGVLLNEPTSEKEADLREEVEETLLWSRKRVKKGITKPVSGVRMLFVGHSILTEPGTLGNVCYLDTGAVKAQNNESPADHFLTAAILEGDKLSLHKTQSFSAMSLQRLSVSL